MTLALRSLFGGRRKAAIGRWRRRDHGIGPASTPTTTDTIVQWIGVRVRASITCVHRAPTRRTLLKIAALSVLATRVPPAQAESCEAIWNACIAVSALGGTGIAAESAALIGHGGVYEGGESIRVDRFSSTRKLSGPNSRSITRQICRGLLLHTNASHALRGRLYFLAQARNVPC
jgi:hypothetical protein